MVTMSRWLTLTSLLIAANACGEAAPGQPDAAFELVVEIQPGTGAPAGMHYQVNGAGAGEVWVANFDSLGDACVEFGDAPLRVECLTADDVSCGLSELDGVCCWAPSVLTSPVVRGTVYVEFAGDGTHRTQEGQCVAKDGSSTHGDDRGPDAGSE